MNSAADTQQPPTNGKLAVLPLVVRDLEARAAVGIVKYGRPLEAGNGRNALLDAYQEALDLACYLRQAIAERDGA